MGAHYGLLQPSEHCIIIQFVLQYKKSAQRWPSQVSSIPCLRSTDFIGYQQIVLIASTRRRHLGSLLFKRQISQIFIVVNACVYQKPLKYLLQVRSRSLPVAPVVKTVFQVECYALAQNILFKDIRHHVHFLATMPPVPLVVELFSTKVL